MAIGDDVLDRRGHLVDLFVETVRRHQGLVDPQLILRFLGEFERRLERLFGLGELPGVVRRRPGAERLLIALVFRLGAGARRPEADSDTQRRPHARANR